MTQLTPEELAACREAYCKEYGYDPEWDVVIDEDFQKAFSAGLFHKQAESAKEIEELKAQVNGMKNVRLNIRHRDCHKAADAFWKYWKENGETHKNGYYEATWGAINSALKVVGVIGTAQEKPNDR